MASSDLAEYAEQPFEALLEIERRARLVSGGLGTAAESRGEWVGLGFQMGEQRLAVAREEVREVLVCPTLTRVPGARDWLRGVANLRGTLLPVTDLRQLLEGPATTIKRRSTRVIVLRHPEIPAGFLVEEVLGFRQFVREQMAQDLPETLPEACRSLVTHAYRQGDQLWPVLSLYQLADSPMFQNAAQREVLA